MKNPEQVTKDVERRLSGAWHLHLAGGDPAFPHTFSMGRTSAEQLHTAYGAVHEQIVAWQRWAHEHGATLTYTPRLAAGGTRQNIPTHVRVDSIEQAAMIVGSPWPQRLARGRERLRLLQDRFPELAEPDRALRVVDSYSDVDFQLLLTVARYLAARGDGTPPLTPRQIAIPGVHAKWLQNHGAGVRVLLDRDDLGLLPQHPARIHFTYLDPDHRAGGGRVRDSATVGDTMVPAYLPRIVVISENKDTALWFPELADAISVEGVGRGGATAAAFDWLRDAPHVVYWGDMDADGLEILDGYRAAFGRDVDSVLMDPESYREFEPFGTNLDKNNAPLTGRQARPVPHLRGDELALYEMLIDPLHTRHRRIEQERIPLHRALAEVKRVAGR